jgi:hypothetical protein
MHAKNLPLKEGEGGVRGVKLSGVGFFIGEIISYMTSAEGFFLGQVRMFK